MRIRASIPRRHFKVKSKIFFLTLPGPRDIIYLSDGKEQQYLRAEKIVLDIFPKIRYNSISNRDTHNWRISMTDKVVNYSDEAVTALHNVYDGTASDEDRKAQVAALAEELGKSAASIRAKLTREGIYVALTKAPAGKAPVRKATLVQDIADALKVDVDVIGSLEKATKNTLERILKAL